MFGSATAVIDVAIGMIFVFLLISFIAKQINDKISEWLRMRAKGMEQGLYKFIIGEQHFQDLLYQNPLITSAIPEDASVTKLLEKTPVLKRLLRSERNPVNIPAGTFSRVLFDTLVPNASGQTTVSQLRAAITTLPANMPLRDPVLTIIATTENDITKVRQNIEDWFDATMVKTTRLYQTHMWHLAMGLSLAIAVIFNVDAINIAKTLWTDSGLRTALVAEANAAAANNLDQQNALNKLNSLNLPIGWVYSSDPRICLAAADFYPRPEAGQGKETPKIDPCAPPNVAWYNWLLKIAGWIITGFAGAQGAPFWFDILKKATQRG